MPGQLCHLINLPLHRVIIERLQHFIFEFDVTPAKIEQLVNVEVGLDWLNWPCQN